MKAGDEVKVIDPKHPWYKTVCIVEGTIGELAVSPGYGGLVIYPVDHREPLITQMRATAYKKQLRTT